MSIRNASHVLLFVAITSIYRVPTIAVGQEPPPNGGEGTSQITVLNDHASAAIPSSGQTSSLPDTAATKPVASPKTTPNDAGAFSIQINDSSIIDLLRQIGNQAQLSIIPSKEVHGAVSAMDLRNVTAREALDAILHANGMDWKQEGKFVYVYSQRELAELEKSSRVRSTEVFHLYYTPAANALSMIKPALSAAAQVSLATPATPGIAGSHANAGSNSPAPDDVIVVNDYPENLEMARKIIGEVDHRPRQLLIETTILQASLTENNLTGIDFSFIGGVNLDKQATPGGLRIGVAHDNLAVFLQALESVTDMVVLANPKVLSLDKQRGEVIVGREDGYLKTTVSQTTSTQTVEFLKTGTRLSFRPFVGDDGYIRMEIHPEDSTGGLTSTNLPFKVTTEVTSNVLVKDGNTIVIGGLFREASQSGKSQIPLLGDIPLLGALFRGQTDPTQRQEIIILLTPHIVSDDEANSRVSKRELSEAEKLRVGVREGMMWSGRERLAESAYKSAVAEMNKPNPDVNKALWHLDCATDLNPKFTDAIEMKEKLTERQVTDVDNSTIRSFVRRQIMAEAATQPSTRSSRLVLTAGQRDQEEALPSAAAVPTTLPDPLAPTRSGPASIAQTQPAVTAAQASDDDPLTVNPAATQRADSSNARGGGSMEIRDIDTADAPTDAAVGK